MRTLVPVLYEEVAIGASPVTLSPPAGTVETRVRFSGGPIRYTPDGSTPSQTVGMEFNDLDERVFDVREAARLKMILKTGAPAATARATHYRPA